MKPAILQKMLLITHIYDLSLSTIMAVGEVQDVFLDPLVKSKVLAFSISVALMWLLIQCCISHQWYLNQLRRCYISFPIKWNHWTMSSDFKELTVPQAAPHLIANTQTVCWRSQSDKGNKRMSSIKTRDVILRLKENSADENCFKL